MDHASIFVSVMRSMHIVLVFDDSFRRFYHLEDELLGLDQEQEKIKQSAFPALLNVTTIGMNSHLMFFHLFVLFGTESLTKAKRQGRDLPSNLEEMETLLAKRLIPPSYANFSMRWKLTKNKSEEFRGVLLIPGRISMKIGHSRTVSWSKRSTFQDFQGFAEPLRLLPATEANTYTNDISVERFSSVELDKSNSLYIAEVLTSKDFGSSLKDLNSTILLCVIDADGDSILQRIYAVSCENPGEGKGMHLSESFHFRRGSADIVTFKGSKLGKIKALWIGLESGSWRLDGIRLTVICGPLSLSESIADITENQFDGLQYEFEANNILLGEGGISVAELRPVLVSELHSKDLSILLNMNSSPTSLSTHEASNEEGMREYADLKFSLLLYDLLLISSGSAILTFSSGEKAALSFLAGGIGGFLYLLVLQRSVDGLAAPPSPSTALRVLKGPLLSLSLAAVAVKYATAGSSMALAPMDLVTGVAGFLTFKIAVALAAFKPIRRSLKDM